MSKGCFSLQVTSTAQKIIENNGQKKKKKQWDI